MKAEAAVDRGTRGLSRWDALEDASPTGTDSSAAIMGTGASGGGTIEEVEADTAVDRAMRCLTGRCGVLEDPSPAGADNGSTEVSERASRSVIVMSNIPALCRE